MTRINRRKKNEQWKVLENFPMHLKQSDDRQYTFILIQAIDFLQQKKYLSTLTYKFHQFYCCCILEKMHIDKS